MVRKQRVSNRAVYAVKGVRVSYGSPNNAPYASGDAPGLSPLSGRIVTDTVYHVIQRILLRARYL